MQCTIPGLGGGVQSTELDAPPEADPAELVPAEASPWVGSCGVEGGALVPAGGCM